MSFAPTKGLARVSNTELRNIIKALSLHRWNNTPEENERLEMAKEELAFRQRNRKRDQCPMMAVHSPIPGNPNRFVLRWKN